MCSHTMSNSPLHPFFKMKSYEERDLSASHEESFTLPLKRARIVEFYVNGFFYHA